MTKELTIKVDNSLIKQAISIKIANAKDMTEATSLLSKCNKFLDAVVAEKEKITQPMNAALKEVRDRYKPTEKVLEEAIDAIRSEMSIYQTAEMKRIKEEEAKIAERVKPGKGNLSAETALKKMEEIEKSAEDKIVTDDGKLSFRADYVVKIMDITFIPYEYLLPNEKMIKEALKEGKEVPGAILEEVMIPINKR